MNKLGFLGEQLAADYLKQNGWKVIETNYQSRFGEIDIIAHNEEYIIFVEVKARNSASSVLPCEAVTKQKQRKIIKTALIFMSDRELPLQPRFDIIEIYDYNKHNKIKHIINAFAMEAYCEGY